MVRKNFLTVENPPYLVVESFKGEIIYENN